MITFLTAWAVLMVLALFFMSMICRAAARSDDAYDEDVARLVGATGPIDLESNRLRAETPRSEGLGRAAARGPDDRVGVSG